MKLLIDSNSWFPAEPTNLSDVSPMTASALRLQSLAQDARVVLCVHPEQRNDILRDRDHDRRNLRLQLIGRYSELINPPAVQSKLRQIVGEADPRSRDEVDDSLLAAVYGNAVNYLVTEDRAMHSKAARAGIGRRVLFLADAIAVLEALFDRAPEPPPVVEAALAYQLDISDPIFASFREDYPGFDEWFVRCQQQGRQTWFVRGQGGYAAVMIVKPEDSLPSGEVRRVLKVCSLKVADGYYGRRYGELLLKTLFEYCRANGFSKTYLTAYEKHESLLTLICAFGFVAQESGTVLGERVFVKEFASTAETLLRGLDFHVRFGPFEVDFEQPALVIPIQPSFYKLLFPEQRKEQLELGISDHAFGNALRKAYLSNSRIKSLPVGSVVWFYRSQEDAGIVACGVLEEWMRSDSADVIAQYVGKRTVYSYDEIQTLSKQEILALLFRQARLLDHPIRLSVLIHGGVLKAAPQSIVRLDESEAQWLSKQIL